MLWKLIFCALDNFRIHCFSFLFAFFLDFFMGLTELKEILTFSVLWVVFYVLENVKAKKKAKADPLISRKKLPAVFLSLWLAKLWTCKKLFIWIRFHSCLTISGGNSVVHELKNQEVATAELLLDPQCLSMEMKLQKLKFTKKKIYCIFTLFENRLKCLIWIFKFWHFSPIYLVTLFGRQLLRFSN